MLSPSSPCHDVVIIVLVDLIQTSGLASDTMIVLIHQTVVLVEFDAVVIIRNVGGTRRCNDGQRIIQRDARARVGFANSTIVGIIRRDDADTIQTRVAVSLVRAHESTTNEKGKEKKMLLETGFDCLLSSSGLYYARDKGFTTQSVSQPQLNARVCIRRREELATEEESAASTNKLIQPILAHHDYCCCRCVVNKEAIAATATAHDPVAAGLHSMRAQWRLSSRPLRSHGGAPSIQHDASSVTE